MGVSRAVVFFQCGMKQSHSSAREHLVLVFLVRFGLRLQLNNGTCARRAVQHRRCLSKTGHGQREENVSLSSHSCLTLSVLIFALYFVIYTVHGDICRIH